ncbi:hypothetical protein BMS3Abin16_01684 [archaeon BMS3Abin16]|nr:hypothetical protein BMS3Abin16_01684 [archaeon BMS3Abin16]HDY74738.1 hypothetical protein [Euryarchaeota archaeon]
MVKGLKEIIVGVIIFVLGAVIYAGISTPAPILYLNQPYFPNERCYPNQMDFSNGHTYKFELSNRAETEAVSKVCLYGDNLTFEIGDIKQNTSICYNEDTVPPKSSGLIKIYNPKIYVNGADNFTLKTTVSCKSKVFRIPRPCDSLVISCNFKERWGNRYQLIS